MLLSLTSHDAVDHGASGAGALVLVNDRPKDCKDGLIGYICCQKSHAFSLRSCMYMGFSSECGVCTVVLNFNAFQLILYFGILHCNILIYWYSKDGWMKVISDVVKCTWNITAVD